MTGARVKALKGPDDIVTRRVAAAALPARGLSLAGWLAALPFLIFSLLLPGTMLEREGSGGVTVVLCAAGSPVEMVIAPDGGQHEKSGHAGRHGCDWAPHSQLAVTQPAAAAPIPAMMPLPLQLVGARSGDLRSQDTVVPLARGPPVPV